MEQRSLRVVETDKTFFSKLSSTISKILIPTRVGLNGVMISIKAPDLFGALLAIGITVMIGIQAVFSIAVVSSSMPVTGIPLPFFSYGGTALIILMFCVGILLNISRKAKI